MAEKEERIQLLHPDPSKSAPHISLRKYNILRQALLTLIPDEEIGVPFQDLPKQVAALLTQEELGMLGNVGWYTISVKLDLEARGLIERVPEASPQRLRRTTMH